MNNSFNQSHWMSLNYHCRLVSFLYQTLIRNHPRPISVLRLIELPSIAKVPMGSFEHRPSRHLQRVTGRRLVPGLLWSGDSAYRPFVVGPWKLKIGASSRGFAWIVGIIDFDLQRLLPFRELQQLLPETDLVWQHFDWKSYFINSFGSL